MRRYVAGVGDADAQAISNCCMFINRRLAEGGVSPSFEEMKEALDLKSKSGIHRLISGLEERGFIRRLPHRARALEVVRLPEETAVARPRAGPATAAGDRSTVLADGHPRRLQDRRLPRRAGERQRGGQLPLYGRIAAGTPIEALRDHRRTAIAVPAEHARQRRALRARSRGRQHDRRRHHRWRHGADPALRRRPRTAPSSSRWSTTTR